MIELTQPSAQLLDSAVVILKQISINVAGLNAFRQCRTALTTVAQLASRGYLDGAEDDTAAGLIDSIANFVQAGNSDYLTELLTLVVQGIIKAQVDGEEPQTITSTFLQVKTYTSLAFDFANISLSAPVSDEILAYNISVPTIDFVNGGGAFCDAGEGYVKFAVGLWGVSPLPNASSSITALLRHQSLNNQSYTVTEGKSKYQITVPFLDAQAFKKYSYKEKLLLSSYNYSKFVAISCFALLCSCFFC